jgi:hypothetical protein
MRCPSKHPFLDAPSSYDEVYQQTYTLCILINNPQDTVNHKNCFFPKLPKMQFTYKYVFFKVHPCPKNGFRLILEVLRGVAQLGRAPGLGPGGRRFESYHPDFFMRLVNHVYTRTYLSLIPDYIRFCIRHFILQNPKVSRKCLFSVGNVSSMRYPFFVTAQAVFSVKKIYTHTSNVSDRPMLASSLPFETSGQYSMSLRSRRLSAAIHLDLVTRIDQSGQPAASQIRLPSC